MQGSRDDEPFRAQCRHVGPTCYGSRCVLEVSEASRLSESVQPRSQVAFSYGENLRPFTLIRTASPDELLPAKLSFKPVKISRRARSDSEQTYESEQRIELKQLTQSPGEVTEEKRPIEVVGYQGEWRHGKRHGRGTEVFENGSRYDGEWKYDFFDGYGSYRFTSGDTYEGGWERNRRVGPGRMVWKAGKRAGDCYVGEWEADQMHGAGEYFKSTGERYAGRWSESCYQGNLRNMLLPF